MKKILIAFVVFYVGLQGIELKSSSSLPNEHSDISITKNENRGGIKLKDANCTGIYSIKSHKIILPYGYYNDYIKGKTTTLPKYINFNFDSANIDTGYLYCIGVKKDGKYKCIDYVNRIIASNNISYVKVGNKSKTYFLFNKKNTKLSFKLPLISKYFSKRDKSITLSLMQHSEKKDKEACLAEDKGLKLALEPFRVGYSISQTLARDDLRNNNYKSKVTITNPQLTKITLYDLYSKNSITTKEALVEFDMSVYKNKLSGFCLKFDMGFSRLHLKEDYDYFCKTTTFGNFNFAVFDDSIHKLKKEPKKAYIQVGAVRLVDTVGGELAFEMLGIDRSSKLIREGYKNLKTTYIGDMIYIVVGPFKDNSVEDELKKVKSIIPDALIYDEELIKCQNRPNGCRKK